MTDWVIFGTGTPTSPNETDGPIALSTGFTINDGGTYWCTGVEFYAASSAPTGVSVALWSRSTDESPSGIGSLLASKDGGTINAGVRNRITFDTAVQVTAAAYPNGLYATMRTGNNYVATGGYFASAAETSGPITAYQNNAGIGFNGRFKVSPAPTGAADSYPNQTFGGGGYWVSPVITDVDPDASEDITITGAIAADAREVAGAALLEVTAAGVIVADERTLAAALGLPVALVGAIEAPERTVAGRVHVPVTEAPPSWEPLRNMFRTAKRQAGNLVRATACPRCGEPLERARGVLHCPFDGWIG